MNNEIKEHFTQYFLNVLKNQYADFSGLADRKQFWFFIFWSWAISTVIPLVSRIIIMAFYIFSEMAAGIVGLLLAACMVLIGLALFIPHLAIQCRRFRDVGLSPWWVLTPIVIIFISGFVIYAIFGDLFMTGNSPENMSGVTVILSILGIIFVNFVSWIAMIIVSVLPSGYFNK